MAQQESKQYKAPEDKIAKYSRVGYIDLDRPVDRLVHSFVSNLPATMGELPARWKHYSVASFLEKYGHLGDPLIAKSVYSHTVVCRGVKVARMWTDVQNSAKVQVIDAVASKLSGYGIQIEPIPESNKRKAKGFNFQARITRESEAKVLALVIRKLFDV